MVRIRGGFRPMDGPGGFFRRFFRRSEGKHTTPPLYCARKAA